MMDDPTIKPFPIQSGGHIRRKDGSEPYWEQPSTIPWWLAEIAYKEYDRQYNNGQSLERLAERGGFGREELVELLRDSKPTNQQTKE